MLLAAFVRACVHHTHLDVPCCRRYKTKWLFVMALPLAATLMFLVAHVAQLCKKRCIQGRRKDLHHHVNLLVATFMVMFYYMYLYLTRTTLDVFNCAPTDPPDGHEYLEVRTRLV